MRGWVCAIKNAGVYCLRLGFVLCWSKGPGGFLAFDRVDFDAGIKLAMAGAATIVFAAIELLDEELFALLEANNGSCYFGSRNGWCADS